VPRINADIWAAAIRQEKEREAFITRNNAIDRRELRAKPFAALHYQ
jgi:hypothetical protein